MPAALGENGLVIGRYVVFDEIAAGGMATVHLGRQVGAVGFARTIAIKRLHSHLSRDEEFSAMFLDEARLAARIRHPNVVQVLDVVHEGGELFLVMDYVQGESFSRLWRLTKPSPVPPRIAVTVMTGVLHGLHAAHEATTEQGEPLHIVHRDVSPQNIMVGIDGVARVLDFGVAKAVTRTSTTRDGALKGKISYMAPEQLLSELVDRRADIYAAAVVLWEALTGTRLFDGDNQGRVVRKILDEAVPVPSSVVPGLPSALDDAIMKGMEKDASKRYQTAREFAAALERCLPAASLTEVGEWVESLGGIALGDRAKRIAEIESRSDIHSSGPVTSPTKLARAEPQFAGPTVPQAFAVMSRQPTDPPPDAHDVKFSSAPPPPDVPPPAVIIPATTSSSKLVAADKAPSSRGMHVASPFAGMTVQTLTVGTPQSAPLASLDPIPVPTPREIAVTPLSDPPPAKKKSSALYVIVAIVVLGGGGAIMWLLLHGR